MDNAILSMDDKSPRMGCNIYGHAVAEAPTGVARALLYEYIVRASTLSPLNSTSIIQVILSYLSSGYEPGRRAYSLKKHSIVLYTPAIFYLVPQQVCRQQKVGTTKGSMASLVTTMIIYHQPATSNQILLDTIQYFME